MTFPEYLQDCFRQFLEYRRAAGFTTRSYEHTLNPFIRFCGSNYPDSDELTKEMIDAWLSHHGYSVNSQANFISCIRQFAGFINFLGKRAYVPDEDYTVRRIQYEPYLFQDQELEDFFDVVDGYVPKSRGNKMHTDLVLPSMLRMMYCCGMRPGEPLRLLRKDVNTESGDVYIRKTKSHRDRHIIMSEDLCRMCAEYDRLAGDREWFFDYEGKPYSTRWWPGFITAGKKQGLPGMEALSL